MARSCRLGFIVLTFVLVKSPSFSSLQDVGTET